MTLTGVQVHILTVLEHHHPGNGGVWRLERCKYWGSHLEHHLHVCQSGAVCLHTRCVQHWQVTHCIKAWPGLSDNCKKTCSVSLCTCEQPA